MSLPPELMLVTWLVIMYELADADAWGYTSGEAEAFPARADPAHAKIPGAAISPGPGA